MAVYPRSIKLFKVKENFPSVEQVTETVLTASEFKESNVEFVPVADPTIERIFESHSPEMENELVALEVEMLFVVWPENFGRGIASSLKT